MAAVPVLSSSVRIQETARDLGVVVDSRLSLSDHVAQSIEEVTTNCDRLFGARRKAPRRPLLSVACTTATPCATASPTN